VTAKRYVAASRSAKPPTNVTPSTVRVSPAPRSAMPITMASAMKGWATPATRSALPPSATIAGSPEKPATRIPGARRNESPMAPSSAVAMAAESQPARAASAGFPAPSFCATTAAAATPKPSAERKQIASMATRAWLAAMASAPSRPMMATKPR